MPEKEIHVRGAREHNLQNIEVRIPRDTLAVITGISGSGKSSLAFDTIYAEGQRRFVESLSAYARQFLGLMEKPDVDSIDGLSPAVSIEQKTTHKNPRSTVGTVTEIYDYLRLLYARIGKPHCHSCGRPMLKQTIQEIVDTVLKYAEGTRLQVLSPIVRGRKGEYKELLRQVAKDGFVRARINGEIKDLDDSITLDRNRKHTIEIIVDRLVAGPGIKQRLTDSVQTAIKYAGGLVVIDVPGGKSELFSELMTCPECNISYGEASPRLFSFNTPYGACPGCDGLGHTMEIDPRLVVPDDGKSIAEGAIRAWGMPSGSYFSEIFSAVAKYAGTTLDTAWKAMTKKQQHAFLYGTGEEKLRIKWASDITGHKSETNRPFEGVVHNLQRRYKQSTSSAIREWIESFMTYQPCEACGGKRLNKEALSFTVGSMNIADLTRFNIRESMDFFGKLELNPNEKKISLQIFKEIKERLTFLLNVGVEYLTMNRAAGTLSGGESQRIRLATQIGSQLVGVLYILDEPSIGLHQRDNKKLIDSLVRLRNIGNTVIVVEHDRETIESADYVVDIGPGAGRHGGKVVAAGTLADIKASPDSITGMYLSGKRQIVTPEKRRPGNGFLFSIKAASGNNLKGIDVDFPLGKLICVTGVSGSGKSTLVNHTLSRILNRHFWDTKDLPLAHRSVSGLKYIDKVISIDQSPIGRTPRSNPATYTQLFAPIRDLYTSLPESKMRGYEPGRFSFNVKGGRCEACEGDGIKKIEMHFLPDVYVTCEVCKGKRYNRETLEVLFKGKSIADVLDMTVAEALDFFTNITAIRNKLFTLKEVGLGYIHLGQQATTLSGGEAQRIKLSTELSKRSTGKTFYILDEPTTGLHFEDVNMLLTVLNNLADRGNTVVVIEHNLDVIKCADHIIDLGPEGGDHGGYVVATGTPEEVAKNPDSYTGQFLKKELK
ncbi:MAG: excinuclease ABC subunit A [Candidatus Raymondbacteria bacterium RIFOXYB2_FULL_49_35]|uniref:UvrABC system protein A n=1 Tax=Candidatus Raymondbacteria bacterium RIFOXYD12_FULL_49_13 TaxID=1817890 RepID=A0A1F7FM20_UNCRA|nr:MAG: excinuclease ABC subunit A [Candidatus Raymondbacteria bacterium RIFOXYC2_FULL_50_21]OGK07631.1 MAG: excinuclease ABC subunit A [Candidatus Raymondbacteria bacterium RIFOXYD12_FULL_49_13]OGP40473.1 MAG: excinuclease ABC subunit A [Candidatus Raymondbacteria bacterium RIFOXYB2_FULL_49_35]